MLINSLISPKGIVLRSNLQLLEALFELGMLIFNVQKRFREGV